MEPQRPFHQPAKITAPRLPVIYHRERLYTLIDEHREYPAFWIISPVGSGKTTLVSGYIERRNIPCLWYQMDGGDADIATFFHYMGLAVRHVSPRGENVLPHYDAKYPVDTAVFSLRYFEKLYQRMRPCSAIVLDNYQDVPGDSGLHEVIRNAVNALPSGHRIFFLSRKAPPGAFVRLKANRVIKTIGWEEIRLTRTETGKIIQLKQGKRRPSPKVVDELHRVTDGWAAGLTLMLQGTRTDDEASGRMIARKSEEVIEYFANEVFDFAKPEVKDLLLKTALFPRMTHGMVEALTGWRHSRRLFPQFHRNHLFIEKYRRQKTVFQYHPLFRDFLLHRLKDAFSKEAITRLQVKAARILEGDGQVEASVALLLQADEGEKAAGVILTHAEALILQGRTLPLTKWFNQLPARASAENPQLSYWMGVCYMSSDPFTARSCFHQAFERFKRLGDRTGLLLSWAGIVESIFYRFDDLPGLDHWIRILDTLLMEDSTFPTEAVEARVAFSLFSALLFRQPHHRDIGYWADRTLELSEKSNDIGSKAYACANLIYFHVMMGHEGKMSAIMESVARIANTDDIDPLVRINVLATKTVYFLGIRDFTNCLKNADRGLSVARKTGVHLRDLLFMGWSAWSALSTNDLNMAETLLARINKAQSRLGALEPTLYNFLRAWEAELKGDPHRTIHHADVTLKILQETGVLINISPLLLLKAKAAHQLERHREADRHLQHAIVLAEKIHSGPQRYGALALKAEMALDRGREKAALNALAQMMALGKKLGFHRGILTYPPIGARICATALHAGIEVEYVQRVIRHQRLHPPEKSGVPANWPWPIKVFTLGRFALWIDDEPVTFPKKAPYKALTFLKALIALGGTDIGLGQLQDFLWPEKEGDDAGNLFSTTLHRLRKILGHENAVYVKDGRIGLDYRYCWVDAHVFLEKIDGAGPHKDGVDPENAICLLREAMALYRGPFLPAEDAPWALPMGERSKSAFVRCVQRVGNDFRQKNQVREAIHCYTLALEVEPLVEDFYASLMVCQADMGQPSQVKSTFRRCRNMLDKICHTVPSPKIQSLYERLIASPQLRSVTLK